MANTFKLVTMARRPKIEIFTDGACSVNPGRGGWAAILRHDTKTSNLEKVICGGMELTTNNRMELLAVISALEIITKAADVTITTDSKYVVDGFTKGWVFNWLKKPNFAGKKNEDLWRRLVKLAEVHKLTFVHVKGHAGHPENEMCDGIAVNVYKSREILPDDVNYLKQMA